MSAALVWNGLQDDELEQMASKCKETVAADGEHVIREVCVSI